MQHKRRLNIPTQDKKQYQKRTFKYSIITYSTSESIEKWILRIILKT
jgi:hypothetical protein